MPAQPRLVLHVVPFSHPCLAVSAALDRLGQEYETVKLVTGRQGDEVEKVYGEGRRTVPGLLVDDEPVHGTSAIFARLDELHPDAGLYPAAVAEAIREAEPGLAEDIQMSARVLVFGAMHFRPESMGTFAGVDQLDPGGVDFAIKSMRAAWRYLDINAQRVHATLQELPAQLDAVDALLGAGAIGGESRPPPTSSSAPPCTCSSRSATSVPWSRSGPRRSSSPCSSPARATSRPARSRPAGFRRRGPERRSARRRGHVSIV